MRFSDDPVGHTTARIISREIAFEIGDVYSGIHLQRVL